MNRSLETLMAVLFVFLLWSWFCYMVARLAFFCLWGWYLVWSFSPSRLDPLLASCLLSSLSVIFFVWCVRRRRFSLFFSLRRWGNPNLFGVWVSPCESSSCARTSTSTRASWFTPTPRHLPSPSFFFFRRQSSFWWWFASVCLGVLGLWVGSGRVVCCMHM